MSDVITFTRIFPEYHIRKGEPTYFVEQILNNLMYQNVRVDVEDIEEQLGLKLLDNFQTKCGSKGHTIRSGYDWQVGDKFTPQVWLGKPRASRLITIAPDLEVKKIWTFECDKNRLITLGGVQVDARQQKEIAQNDGLEWIDFVDWIIKPCYNVEVPFKGQIICWDDSIVYEVGG